MRFAAIGTVLFLLGSGGIASAQTPRGNSSGMAARLFQVHDRNRDGKLTGDEIPDRMRQRLARIDQNKDGVIELKELESVFRGRGRGRGPGAGRRGDPERLWAFLTEEYDKNNDGKLSKSEYDRAEAFTRFDRNKDGVLTRDDFASGVQSQRNQRGNVQLAVGDTAPDFELTHVTDAKKKDRLSSFAGSQPVALIFGSCT